MWVIVCVCVCMRLCSHLTVVTHGRQQFDAEIAVLKEELSRKETSGQKRVDRAQREVQGMRAEMMMHVSDKAKLEEEVERWR